MTIGGAKSDVSAAGARAASTLRPLRVETTELFGDRREIVIVHQQDEYRLRITKNGKLILTK